MRALPDHALLDRLVRGRVWIPLLGVMLAGIVAMQVEALKLGASIGRSIERSSALQSRNELLRASVASLADDQRIERLAAGMGMIMPAPDAVGFLSAQPGGNAQHAAASIRPPDASAFLSLQSSNGAVAIAVPAAASTTPTQLQAPVVASTIAASPSTAGQTPGSAVAPTPPPAQSGPTAQTGAGPTSSGAQGGVAPQTGTTVPTAPPTQPASTQTGATGSTNATAQTGGAAASTTGG